MSSKRAPRKRVPASAAGPHIDHDDLARETLDEMGIAPLEVFPTDAPLPVAIIHAPRGAGISTLLAALLVDAQPKLGLTGAVVLCDRPCANYMGGVIPTDVIVNKPPGAVLAALINMQQYRKTIDTLCTQRLVLVLDDVLYSSKLLKSPEFLRDVKRAKDFDIMVLIATTDVGNLPNNISTFATHVFATACVSPQDTKALYKTMFSMFDAPKAFSEVLSACRRYEFLVGLLRGAQLHAYFTSIVRRYMAPQYTSAPRPLRVVRTEDDDGHELDDGGDEHDHDHSGRAGAGAAGDEASSDDDHHTDAATYGGGVDDDTVMGDETDEGDAHSGAHVSPSYAAPSTNIVYSKRFTMADDLVVHMSEKLKALKD